MTRSHRKNSRLRLFIIPAAAVAILCLLPRLGPASQTGQDKPLQYESVVSVKLVQVYVTGKKGVPVTDLTAADFEIFDNDRSYPVAHFEKHFVETEPAAPVPAAAAPAVIPPLSRKFFLVFDFALTNTKGLRKAKDAALKFLDGDVRPTDEIGVVSYTINRGLVLHEYLTTDHARVRAIVDGFGVRPLAGRAENLTQFNYSFEIALVPGNKKLDDSVPDPENQFYESQAGLQSRLSAGQGPGVGGRSYIDQAREFFTALGQMAKVLRYIPGFKNIILFSGGIARRYLYGDEGGAGFGSSEWTTPEQLAGQMTKYDSAQGNAILRETNIAMLKEFEASNCPVFSVDVSQMGREGDVSSFDGISGSAIRAMEGADSLRQFAGETGGKFYAKTMTSENIVADIQRSTSGYYVLGYSVDETWDGAFHKIKVKVNRKSVDVKTQGGYFSPKPFKDYTRFEKLLNVVDLALSDSPLAQAAYEIPVVALPLTVKGSSYLLAFTRVSRDAHADILGKKAEVYILLMNEKGDVVVTRSYRLEIPGKAKGTIFPSFLLPVNPGSYVSRMVVREMETGRGARGAASVVIPARAGGVLSLDPPLLINPEKDAMDLTSASGESLSGFYGYDPKLYAPFVGDVPAGTAEIQVALRAPGGAIGLQIKAFLLNPTTSARTEVPVSILERSAEGTTWLFLAKAATGELSPGRFTLTFEAWDPQTGGAASSSAQFTVK
ncbi:MAG: VWA domain-containing protein [Candidatus Aminicenantales bacterium]